MASMFVVLVTKETCPSIQSLLLKKKKNDGPLQGLSQNHPQQDSKGI